MTMLNDGGLTLCAAGSGFALRVRGGFASNSPCLRRSLASPAAVAETNR